MSEKFDELIAVMARLRAPGGCPWDAEQTYASLSQYLLEEAYETFDAIHEADYRFVRNREAETNAGHSPSLGKCLKDDKIRKRS